MVPDLTHCMLASPGRERRWAWGCCFSWASASLACTQSSDSSFIRGWQCTATSEGHVGGVNDLEEVGMCGTCARSSMGPFPSLHLWACSHQTSWKAGVQFSSVQSLSRVRLFATPWITACQASLSITNSWSSLKLMSIESGLPYSHLMSPSPPAPNPSQNQGLFQWVNSLHEVAKVLEFQLHHQSFQWTPRTDGLGMT